MIKNNLKWKTMYNINKNISLIIKSYSVDKKITFHLNNIKSYTNGNIYNNIYIIIQHWKVEYINNDKEIEECKSLYKNVISIKDKIITIKRIL